MRDVVTASPTWLYRHHYEAPNASQGALDLPQVRFRRQKNPSVDKESRRCTRSSASVFRGLHSALCVTSLSLRHSHSLSVLHRTPIWKTYTPYVRPLFTRFAHRIHLILTTRFLSYVLSSRGISRGLSGPAPTKPLAAFIEQSRHTH